MSREALQSEKYESLYNKENTTAIDNVGANDRYDALNVDDGSKVEQWINSNKHMTGIVTGGDKRGSVVSVKSTTSHKSKRAGNSMGSQVSLKSNVESENIGSQVSLKSTKVKSGTVASRSESVVTLTSEKKAIKKDTLGSNTLLRSSSREENEAEEAVFGSKASLRAPGNRGI